MGYFGFKGSDGVGFGQGPFYSLTRPPEKVPPVVLSEIGGRFISQYATSYRIRQLVRARMLLAQKEVMEPIYKLSRMLNINEAEGVFLDLVGQRLGFPRPLGKWVGSSTKRFGFKGSDGLGFGQAPFKSAADYVRDAPQLQDLHYRKLLLGRAKNIRGNGSWNHWQEIIRAIVGEGANVELSATGKTINLKFVRYPDKVLVDALQPQEVRHRLFPVPAGYELNITVV